MDHPTLNWLCSFDERSFPRNDQQLVDNVFRGCKIDVRV